MMYIIYMKLCFDVIMKCNIKGRMHERRLSLIPSLVPDLVLPTTFSVCTKAD